MLKMKKRRLRVKKKNKKVSSYDHLNVIYKTFDFIISLGVLILIKYFEANNEETKCCNYFTQNKISTFFKKELPKKFSVFYFLFFYFGKCFFFLLTKRVFHFENTKKFFSFFSL